MNRLRRALILAGGTAAIPMSMGCVTTAMMSGGEYESYTEKVSSILISADGKTLAVLGQEFHYLFDAPVPIKAILDSELREIVEASFNAFRVDGNQRITGGYTLRIGKNAAAEAKERALAAGFKALPTGDLLASGTLAGTRYAANGIQPAQSAQKLRKEYVINITAEKSAGAKAANKAGKLLLTPITLAADGVLILIAVPLLLLAVVVAPLSR